MMLTEIQIQMSQRLRGSLRGWPCAHTGDMQQMLDDCADYVAASRGPSFWDTLHLAALLSDETNFLGSNGVSPRRRGALIFIFRGDRK
jgi:hypothetical protein